jgi:hypothetical protein
MNERRSSKFIHHPIPDHPLKSRNLPDARETNSVDAVSSNTAQASATINKS